MSRPLTRLWSARETQTLYVSGRLIDASGQWSIYRSGDAVPYEGMADKVKSDNRLAA
ncbi:MAG: hypothetical protein WKF84_28455 [Pyrinomonadaceae bacterium]